MEKTSKGISIELTKFDTLKEALSYKGIEKIETLDEVSKYFDITDLDDDGTPIVTCDMKTVIITDNEIYNETYMIDLFNKYIEDNPEIVNTVKFLYIDNFDLRKKLFAPSIEYTIDTTNDETLEKSKRSFEKAFLVPTIMLLNPLGLKNIPALLAYEENISPFTYDFICELLRITKINEVS